VKRVVSVSLGSAARDHRATIELSGERVAIERRGYDGRVARARDAIAELDRAGEVAAIGLGGIDLYLHVGARRYAMRDGERLRAAALRTPVVDGSGLKNTLEYDAVAIFARACGLELYGKNVLMVSALDRYGMARGFIDAGARVLFGDFIFALDLDRPVRDLAAFEALAERYLPDACRLPFQFFYPTGAKQDRPPEPKYASYYEEADLIAGDFHFIRRYLPPRLDGKIVVTNTVTAGDVQDLRARGVATLVTTTPDLGGRSFGTNAIEAALVAVLGPQAAGDDAAIARAAAELGLRPHVRHLRGGAA